MPSINSVHISSVGIVEHRGMHFLPLHQIMIVSCLLGTSGKQAPLHLVIVIVLCSFGHDHFLVGLERALLLISGLFTRI